MRRMLAPVPKIDRRFQLVLIKPSHYDDDGYVVQWWCSSIPANSLACVYTLAADAAQRQALGSDVAVDITAMDESNCRVRVKDVINLIRKHEGSEWWASSACNRTSFREPWILPHRCGWLGVQVAWRVSRLRLLAMLPEVPAELQAADRGWGSSLFAGEAEGRLRAGAAGRVDRDAEAAL